MKKKILLVDNEPDIIKTTAIALEQEGFEVITALEADQALKKARCENPDLIILDVMLAGMPGSQIASLLKKDQEYRHIPIILITALTQKHEQELLRNSGADFYLKKPFELNELSGKIRELLALRQDPVSESGS